MLQRLSGAQGDFATRLLFPIVSLSIAVILFEGGLTLRWGQLAGNASTVVRLITIASAITWVLTAVVSHYLLGLSWGVAWLLGAILMVTGPTVVGPLLRQIRPNRRLTSILQWEGFLIDPVGAIAAVLVFEATSVELNRKFAEGCVIKSTPLTEAFTLKDFYEMHGEDSVVMMAVGADNRLKVRTSQAPFNCVPGDSVIAMVRKKDKPVAV